MSRSYKDKRFADHCTKGRKSERNWKRQWHRADRRIAKVDIHRGEESVIDLKNKHGNIYDSPSEGGGYIDIEHRREKDKRK